MSRLDGIENYKPPKKTPSRDPLKITADFDHTYRPSRKENITRIQQDGRKEND
jgi:hypothetical protein